MRLCASRPRRGASCSVGHAPCGRLQRLPALRPLQRCLLHLLLFGLRLQALVALLHRLVLQGCLLLLLLLLHSDGACQLHITARHGRPSSGCYGRCSCGCYQRRAPHPRGCRGSSQRCA